jgi:hypothetical protein
MILNQGGKMKKIIVVLIATFALLACSTSSIYCNKEYHIFELDGYILTWAEADSYEKALFQCKGQIVRLYYPEVLNGDPDQDWMAVMTSIFSEEVIDEFIVKDTGKHYVSIRISKDINDHLIKRE